MTKVNITPLGDRVVVDPKIKEDSKAIAGIILPDSVKKEKPKQGRVVAVGDLKDIKNVKVGDIVFFSDFGYDEVEVANDEYYIIQSKNLLAVIK